MNQCSAPERLRLLDPLVIRGFAAKLRFARLLQGRPERPLWALFMFVNGFISIAIMAVVGWISHSPFIFPSLGPTAFLFFYTPNSPTASPRHTICGHAIGIGSGAFALWVTGLQHTTALSADAITGRRIFAAALSLALTGALMILLKAAHPPAGATTLIISLGLVTVPFHWLIIEIAVAALTLQAIAMNRLAGLAYPWWAARAAPGPSDIQ